MFGLTLIRKERLAQLEETERQAHSIIFYTDWFSGWPDILWLLKKFRAGEVYNSSVWGIRSEFAKKMGTDDWGKPSAEARKESESE